MQNMYFAQNYLFYEASSQEKDLRLVLQLSLPNSLKPGVKLRMKM